MSTALGLDLGTTYFKAALFDADDRMLARARRPTPAHSPQPGWSQMDPAHLRETVIDLVRELRGQDPQTFRDATALGFATQTNSFLLLDDEDRPLTPIILWNDDRAKELAIEPVHDFAGEAFRRETGVPAIDAAFVPMKWLWLAHHEPGVIRRAKTLRLIGDELTCWLCGHDISEAGTAGLTGLVDIHRLTWRRQAMESLGMDGLTLRPIVRAGAELGTLRPAAADALGLRPHCRVVAGCLDQYAGAVGAGALGPGQVLETTGTVLSVVRTAEAFDAEPGPGVFQGPAFRPNAYHQMCFGNVSANLLERWRCDHAPDRDFAALDRDAAEVPAGAEGLTLDAEASDAAGRAVFRNRRPHHGHAHEVRAILEGVADALAAQLHRLCGDRMPRRVVAAGGAARSELWRQIKSERLGVPVVRADCEEPACLGAAKLARGMRA